MGIAEAFENSVFCKGEYEWLHVHSAPRKSSRMPASSAEAKGFSRKSREHPGMGEEQTRML